MYLYLTQNNHKEPKHSSFKAGCYIETALVAITAKLNAIRSKLSLVLIVLDLSAAFDTVNYNILLSILISLGISDMA